MINRSTGTAFLGAIFILGLCLAMPGCGGGRETPGTTSRMHPANWITVHPASAMQSLDHCTVCHEMTALKAGSAIPSCMTTECHHGMSPGYAGAGSHGALAKAAPGVSGGGLASCQTCHGQDFAGGGSGSACASCHRVKAPHPPKPWHDASGFNHATTNPVNGPICGQCHFAGSTANPAGHPATPAPAGTPPGCYNNTECHGAAGAPHLLGSIWKDATSASFHGLEAKKDLLYCQSCHGTPGTTAFDGGAATTKCSTCHASAGAHSTVWYPAPVTNFPSSYIASHRNALKQDTACPVCHDYTKGRTAPLPPAPSCFSSSSNANACHANGPGKADHPIPFTQVAHTTVTQAGFDSNCQTCHAVTGNSPVSAAPTCAVCHQGGSPLTLTTCASCHEKPPAGAAFPDIAGAHAKHDALAGITAQCSACHQGFDSGSQAHYDRGNGRPGNDALRVPPGATGFLATYSGKAGSASFDSTTNTCSNMSCHGGITTPNWVSGTIASTTNVGCLLCHTLGSAQGTPENNSPYSGRHSQHLGGEIGALCTDCHSMTNGTPGAANHFAHLDTSQMEGPASDTIQYQGSRAVYNATAKTCTLTCHGQPHNADSWTGGGN